MEEQTVNSGDPLAGARILVVEDSPVIAIVIEDMLQDFGCEVVGPTGSMAIAMDLASEEALDGAVIDVNIRGGKVFPVAEKLIERDVPFLFASGYADWTLPEALQDRPRLVKPYDSDLLRKKLLALLNPK